MTLLLCILIAKSILVLPDITVTPGGIAGITGETTLEDLESMFGTGNVEVYSVHLGEGFYSDGASVSIHGGSRLTVVFEEGFAASVIIEDSGPKTPEGIGLGSTLTDLEEVIGEFQMAGFAWDNEGYVELTGTIYEGLYMRLTPEVPVPERYMGDALFPSGELRGYNPVLTDLRVVF